MTSGDALTQRASAPIGREKPIHDGTVPPAAIGGGPDAPYPVRFDVEYPQRLSRLSTLFRLPLLIPALIFLGIIGQISQYGTFAGWVAVFVRRRYPRWLFGAITGYLGFNARFSAYWLLLTDRYPAFESANTPVSLEFDEPPQGRLSRWRVLFWKAVLLVPHVIVLFFLWIAVVVVVFIAWWAILFIGRYPRGMFNFVTGVLRWQYRVWGYFASFNDRFPPFALSADAGPGEGSSAVISGVFGAFIAAGVVAGGIAIAVVAGEPEEIDTTYAGLLRGDGSELTAFEGNFGEPDVIFQLARASEDDAELANVIVPEADETLVIFEWLVGVDDGHVDIDPDDFELKVRLPGGDEQTLDAELTLVEGRAAPERIEEGEVVAVEPLFLVPDDAEPISLRIRPSFREAGGIRYNFTD